MDISRYIFDKCTNKHKHFQDYDCGKNKKITIEHFMKYFKDYKLPDRNTT